MRLHRALIDTPIGPMRAVASGDALCALEFFSPGRMERLDARFARWFPSVEFTDQPSRAVEAIRAWLHSYFDGDSAVTSSLHLDMRGTPFELKVWQALRDIPAGTTTSYGAIAKHVGAPSAARAVGLANGANPLAIVVPCHRVIGASGTLTGYGGGLETKAWLLAHERRWADPRLF